MVPYDIEPQCHNDYVMVLQILLLTDLATIQMVRETMR